MKLGFWKPGPEQRNAVVAAVGVVLVGIGSGAGVYLDSRAHPPLQQPAARIAKGVPTPPPVGLQSVVPPQQAVILSVVNTSPADGANAIPIDASITIRFNLAVNPTAVKSFMTVITGDLGSPVTGGKVAQGKTPDDIVFKPSAPFQLNDKVSVSLQSGLQSRDGTSLKSDYNFSFITVLAPHTVDFGGTWLQSSPSGVPVTLGIQAGRATMEQGDVTPAHFALKTYKATVNDLLAALVHDKNGAFLGTINTSSMHLMDAGVSLTASGARVTNPESADSVTIAEPDGIYLLLAVDGQDQLGYVWVNFSRYGILLRQDDQRVVVAGQDLISGDTKVPFQITFYNLAGGVHPKLSGAFTGTGEFPARFPSGFDVAVATSGQEEVVAPITVPSSGAYIGLSADLAKEPQLFLTTDRRAYQKGEVVRFGGMARVSNDQTYSLGFSGKVEVWTDFSLKPIAVVPVAPDGTFSGSFAIPNDAFNPDGTDARMTVHAGVLGADHFDPNLLRTSTTIVALALSAPLTSLTVHLDKPVYVASDTIVTSIAGVNGKGQSLAGQTVNLAIYASEHVVQPVEMDSFATPSTWGDPVRQNIKVRLDSTGHATYSFKANITQKHVDQELTVAVTYGFGRAASIGKQTSIVYQAADEVFLLDGSRYGQSVVARFVVESRSGSRVAQLPMAYELDRTDYEGDKEITTVVSGGKVVTDANGLGTIRAAYSGAAASLVLRVLGKDASGNPFEADAGTDVDPGFTGTWLDVASDKIAYTVGDSAHLNVTSSKSVMGLLSLERGRVHQYRWLQLTKGDNTLAVDITPELAPGFAVVFSYFDAGSYSSESFPIHINNSNRLLKVVLTTDQPTYAKGQTAHVTVTVADSTGAPVAANLLADGYDARMSSYKLVDQSSIAGAFLTPTPVMTNGTSSLVGIGYMGGGCGGGGDNVVTDAPYSGHTARWAPDLTTDATGHLTISIPIALARSVRLVVMAGTATSWGQAEIDLAVQ